MTKNDRTLQKRLNFTKFLGIYIDEHLSWAQHIDYLSKKIARNVGILSKLKYFLPRYIMNTLYYSLILSHLQYCTLLWANAYSTCLNSGVSRVGLKGGFQKSQI